MTSRIRSLALAVLFTCGAAAQNQVAMRDAIASCGPAAVHFKVHPDKSQHPTPGPETGKARVYLIGDSTFGVDGQWVGASNAWTYFSISLEPGRHHVCARFSHWLPAYGLIPTKVTLYSVHSLDAQADQTYYLGPLGYPYPTYYLGAWGPLAAPSPDSITRAAPIELVQYDADEGVRIVASSRFSTSRPK